VKLKKEPDPAVWITSRAIARSSTGMMPLHIELDPLSKLLELLPLS
jgi:hypothetical protein